MDRDALAALLDAENVEPSAYSLDGGMPFEAYVLERRPSDWAVYYSERGLRSGDPRACDGNPPRTHATRQSEVASTIWSR